MPPVAVEVQIWAGASESGVARVVGPFVDPAWYLLRYPDVAAAGIDPLVHYVRFGGKDGRDPNKWFDTAWYARHYPDAVDGGSSALLHYIQVGAAELRNPHPDFDAPWYVEQHPEAAANPVLYHLRYGDARGYLTESPVDIGDYLPSQAPTLKLPDGVLADVIVPVYRGLRETKVCIEAVLADQAAPLGNVIVVDDRSPEPALSAWLKQQAEIGRFVLVRNTRNLGFAGSVNAGIAASSGHDVVVLHNDTEVPNGWLRRLAAQAYARPDIGIVSPFSSDTGISLNLDDTGGLSHTDVGPLALDAACQSSNTGRSVALPTNSGCCLYIRRDALTAVTPPDSGPFDTRFPHAGYGADTDFCLRVTASGWTHRLACDVFVAHSGQISFGQRSGKIAVQAANELSHRHPVYAQAAARPARRDPSRPFRFAVTATLLRQSGLPVILMVAPAIGGGVRRHVDSLVTRLKGVAHALLLEGGTRGTALSLPSPSGGLIATLPAKRVEDMATLLHSMDVSRVHIHHLAQMDMDVRQLIHRLGVPFDITVHDYQAICPQIVLLPWPEGLYCGEPDAAACNACIAASPSAHEARDILVWRREKAWQYLEADRVICPSGDVMARLTRYGLAERAIVVPHEPVVAAQWPLHLPRNKGQALRIALLGTMANHKGSRVVAAVARAAPPGTIDLHLIGYLEETFPREDAGMITATGPYQDADLPDLLRASKADVVWLPSTAPETYSYTLTTAIEAGLPIVATNLGAFTERLDGRPFTWLTDYRASTAELLAVFDTVRAALRDHPRKARAAPPATIREAIPDFYGSEYLIGQSVRTAAAVGRTKPLVVLVPERNEGGGLSPCAYIRLLHPLDHPAIGGDIDLVLADADSALQYQADVILTQRYALPNEAAAYALAAHARATRAHLVYDLDDDLLNIPRGHPDARALRPRAKIVRRMLEQADTVWLSTPGLAERLRPIRPDAMLIENGLDERIWTYEPVDPAFEANPVRILCMGTSTHDRDFELIQPALVRLKAAYGERVSIDVLGMTGRADLPKEQNRIGPSAHGNRSYPAFVDWINSVSPAWHIGLAPLLDTPFNRAKSSIKAMDYAAMGLVVLASDMPVYRGSLADGPAGRLVANDPQAWFEALSWLVRAQDVRRSIAAGARAAFLATSSLHSQTEVRRDVWRQVLRRSRPGLTMGHG